MENRNNGSEIIAAMTPCPTAIELRNKWYAQSTHYVPSIPGAPPDRATLDAILECLMALKDAIALERQSPGYRVALAALREHYQMHGACAPAQVCECGKDK